MSKDKAASPVIKRSPADYLEQARGWVRRYRVVLFIVFVCGLYSFMLYQIYSLSDQPTDQTSLDSQVNSLTPHIDQSVVQQLESLKDNSVSVKALFDKARQNPFAE